MLAECPCSCPPPPLLLLLPWSPPFLQQLVAAGLQRRLFLGGLPPFRPPPPRQALGNMLQQSRLHGHSLSATSAAASASISRQLGHGGGWVLVRRASCALHSVALQVGIPARFCGTAALHADCMVLGGNKAALHRQEECVHKNPIKLPDDEPLLLKSTTIPRSVISSENASCDADHRLILVDGKAVIYRAYYKLMAKLHYGKLEDANANGDWVLTVFTALSTILRVLKLNATHAAVVFDHDGGYFFYTPPKSCTDGFMHTGLTFRHTMFPAYKMNRLPTPDTIVQSLQYLKPALLAMAIKVIEVPGVEADDVIGTLAISAVTAGMKVRVLSPDKDFFQIISPSLRLLRFVPRGSGIVSFGIEEFSQRFGSLQPSQFIDYLALVGDRVDNIPGVQGIGEKTAVQLIELFGSLEKLVQDRDKVQNKKAREGLLADNGEVLFTKRLVTLRTDLPYHMVPFTLDEFACKKPEDGGEKYMNLINAMGSFVDKSITSSLESRTRDLWSSY